MQRVKAAFFWVKMRRMVQQVVQECTICQKNKGMNTLPAGLMQPLLVPKEVWSEISMDFVEGLPSSKGKTCILVVVDRLSKMAHFIALSHPYTAVTVAEAFFQNIYKLYGMPKKIVSNRDPVFTSLFWKELFNLQGTRLNYSTAYHPQSDGQTEAVNRVMEMYLRCFTRDQPKNWVKWLPWSELCYNTSLHGSLGKSPYQVVYGRDPPTLLDYIPGATSVEAAEKELLSRDEVIKRLREKLLESQNRMKKVCDKGVTDRSSKWVSTYTCASNHTDS